MRNLRLDICYDGTRYQGWQRLPGVENTIQNVGRLARIGMAETDKEIIDIMISGTARC